MWQSHFHSPRFVSWLYNRKAVFLFHEWYNSVGGSQQSIIKNSVLWDIVLFDTSNQTSSLAIYIWKSLRWIIVCVNVMYYEFSACAHYSLCLSMAKEKTILVDSRGGALFIKCITHLGRLSWSHSPLHIIIGRTWYTISPHYSCNYSQSFNTDLLLSYNKEIFNWVQTIPPENLLLLLITVTKIKHVAWCKLYLILPMCTADRSHAWCLRESCPTL